jgi:5,10-methylenetetrahydromethanopterin reductase
MRFGIGLVGEHTPQRMIELSRLIEGYGFDYLWVSDERFYRDVFVNMTLVACHTTTVKIGSMVTDPFIRHPAVTAAAAASLDELSGGRCVIGMGAGISGFQAMGIQRAKPARAIKEAVQLIHRLTAGEKHVTYEGELIQFRGGHLNFEPLRRVPVYVAGRGPRVLQVAGEVADGVVIGSFASERGIAWGLAQADRGARRVGRRLEQLEKVSWLYTSVSSDARQARDLVRKGVAVAMWGSKEILPNIGVTLPPATLRLMEGPYGYDTVSELARAIPENLLEEFSVAGTVEEVAAKLTRIGRMGIDQAAMWVFPPEGKDVETVLKPLAEDVLPRVRAALEAPKGA